MRLLHLHYAVEMSSTIRFDHGRVASPFGPRYKGHMARARHMLLALLAVIGIFSLLPMAGASAACPTDTMASMPTMHHHGQSAPMGRDACPACIAVLPSLPTIETNALPPVAVSDSQGRQLFGIDPGLDPPPPRAA